MITVKYYDSVDDNLLKFAVILSKSDNKWVICKEKSRETLEVPGGRREANEAILDTAKRELYEETGALDYTITPVCIYSYASSESPDNETFGMLYYANIHTFESDLHYEIEKVLLLDELPTNWTYPHTLALIKKAQQQLGI